MSQRDIKLFTNIRCLLAPQVIAFDNASPVYVPVNTLKLRWETINQESSRLPPSFGEAFQRPRKTSYADILSLVDKHLGFQDVVDVGRIFLPPDRSILACVPKSISQATQYDSVRSAHLRCTEAQEWSERDYKPCACARLT